MMVWDLPFGNKVCLWQRTSILSCLGVTDGPRFCCHFCHCRLSRSDVRFTCSQSRTRTLKLSWGGKILRTWWRSWPHMQNVNRVDFETGGRHLPIASPKSNRIMNDEAQQAYEDLTPTKVTVWGSCHYLICKDFWGEVANDYIKMGNSTKCSCVLMTDTGPYATKIMPGCQNRVGDQDLEDQGVSLVSGWERVHRNYCRQKRLLRNLAKRTLWRLRPHMQNVDRVDSATGGRHLPIASPESVPSVIDEWLQGYEYLTPTKVTVLGSCHYHYLM